MYLPYVYFIKHKITNEFYHGSRYENVKKCRTPESDFWVHYFTSSPRVKDLIEQYGKDSFDVSVIYQFGDHTVCYWLEQLLIKESIKDPLCLNKHYIDPDSDTRKFSRAGTPHTDKAKKKLRDCNLGKTRSSVSIDKLKRTVSNKTADEKLQTSLKISAAAKNRPPITEETRVKLRKLKVDTTAYTAAAFAREAKKKINGFKVSPETCKKLANVNQGRKQEIIQCPHCDKSGGNSMRRWHFNNCKNA